MSPIDLPWGFWNGLTAWIVLVVHVFGGWTEFPVFDVARNGNWYTFGFWWELARRSSGPRALALAIVRPG